MRGISYEVKILFSLKFRLENVVKFQLRGRLFWELPMLDELLPHEFGSLYGSTCSARVGISPTTGLESRDKLSNVGVPIKTKITLDTERFCQQASIWVIVTTLDMLIIVNSKLSSFYEKWIPSRVTPTPYIGCFPVYTEIPFQLYSCTPDFH